MKTVYLAGDAPVLSTEELHTYPEVVMGQSFEDLKKYASPKAALWIDKSATPFNAGQEAVKTKTSSMQEDVLDAIPIGV